MSEAIWRDQGDRLDFRFISLVPKRFLLDNDDVADNVDDGGAVDDNGDSDDLNTGVDDLMLAVMLMMTMTTPMMTMTMMMVLVVAGVGTSEVFWRVSKVHSPPNI